jgi:hypothetical protein
MSRLTGRSFNVLMNAGFDSKEDVKRHILSGKLSVKTIRNLGQRSLTELVKWSGAQEELGERSVIQANLEKFVYELENC